MNAINKENSKVFLLILLGMLSAFGPFVTDMYLPSLPAMADYLVRLAISTAGVRYYWFRCYYLSCPRCFVFLHRTFIRLSLCG